MIMTFNDVNANIQSKTCFVRERMVIIYLLAIILFLFLFLIRNCFNVILYPRECVGASMIYPDNSFISIRFPIDSIVSDGNIGFQIVFSRQNPDDNYLPTRFVEHFVPYIIPSCKISMINMSNEY